VIGIAIFPISGENYRCLRSIYGAPKASTEDGLKFVCCYYLAEVDLRTGHY
jgi:hypothetical protein